MAQKLDESVLRVLDAKGETVGTAFLVADRLAVTCAHAIMMAGSEPGETLQVQFFRESTGGEALVLPLPPYCSWQSIPACPS